MFFFSQYIYVLTKCKKMYTHIFKTLAEGLRSMANCIRSSLYHYQVRTVSLG